MFQESEMKPQGTAYKLMSSVGSLTETSVRPCCSWRSNFGYTQRNGFLTVIYPSPFSKLYHLF